MIEAVSARESTLRATKGVVLVTGASAGIGREVVLECLRRGLAVSACARREARLAELVRAAGELAPALHVHPADVTRPAETAAWIEAARDRFGAIRALVNNAGYGHNGPIDALSVEDFREQFETNFFAVVDVTKKAIPHLEAAGGGDIVMISSVLGHVALAGRAPYCASKWALEGFSEALRQELRPRGIRVSVVNPGFTATEFPQAMKVRGARPPGSRLRAMPAATVARVVVDTFGRTRRRVLLTALGKAGVWLHAIAPAILERVGERAFTREMEQSRLAGTGPADPGSTAP